MKGLALSIAGLTISGSFQGTSAFIAPSWQAAHQAVISSPCHDTNPAVASVAPSIESKLTNYRNLITPNRHVHGTYTKLWAKTEDEDSSKAINKGSQKKDAPTATSKSNPKTKTVRKSKGTGKKSSKKPIEISAESLTPSQTNSVQRQPENDGEYDDNVENAFHIPTTGYSLADQLENKSPENRERFETTLTPIVEGIREKKELEFQYDDDGFPTGFREAGGGDNNEDDENRHEGVARIDTVSSFGNAGEEPVRWLIALDNKVDGEGSGGQQQSYAMIDLPPYSDKLANEIRFFMDPEYNATTTSGSDGSGTAKASLDVILMTNQQCIHYDSSPAVYVTRKSDLKKWKAAFPSAEAIMYRLDVPRECREEVTQVLDGYGPWGWEEGDNRKFVETGRPLTMEEWDDDTKEKVLTQGELPPDDQVGDEEDQITDSVENEDDALYSPEAIREREEKHRLLAVYTPGHTFGSVTYIFPKRGICCSGYTLPLESSSGADAFEDDYDDDASVTSSTPIPPQGPRLDYQGYLATSASRPRQMSSALSLINTYIDRFRVVLPARGDVVFLDTETELRKRELMESVGLYKKIGDIYGRLGIVE